jgi:hypothetical protein
MGYYTNFEIEVKQNVNGEILNISAPDDLEYSGVLELTKEQYAEFIFRKTLFEKLNEVFDDNLENNGELSGYGKWYHYDKDMAAFAAQYPDIIFIVSAVGEGDGNDVDTWKHYFKGNQNELIQGVVTFANPTLVGVT